MARRRFYFNDGQSAKFWEIRLIGKRYAIRYGRLGTDGRTLEKQFASEADAKEAFHRLIREKLKKGYLELRGPGPYPERPARSPIRASRKRSVAAPAQRKTRKRVLSDVIYREAEKKGADISRRRDLPKSVKRCPDLVAEFYQNIIWPKRLEFHTEIDDCLLEGISFYGPVQEIDCEAYGVLGCEKKDLFGVGSHNGGNWILLLDGNDRRKSDPTVYEVDHELEAGEELRTYGRLSKFLRSMQDSA